MTNVKYVKHLALKKVHICLKTFHVIRPNLELLITTASHRAVMIRSRLEKSHLQS